MQDSLFTQLTPSPLAHLLRPTKLADIVGQPHLTGPRTPLTRRVAAKRLPSMLFYGPPGSGKTSLARAIAQVCGMPVRSLSAVEDGAAALAKILTEAKHHRDGSGRQTLLFVDEIGEWTKAQQRNLLPCTEDGSVVLIGATTANAGFSIIPPLLSRLTAYEFRALDEAALEELLERAAAHLKIDITKGARRHLIAQAGGDGRTLLNMVEDHAVAFPGEALDEAALELIMSSAPRRHDRAGDSHCALLSALQKSVRGSDPDAAVLYLGMLHQGGEPPRNIFRRLLIMATEEVGLSDPSVLIYVQACADAYERVGEPEGLDQLMAAALRIAIAEKSNATHVVKARVAEFLAAHPGLSPPRHIVNAVTEEMKQSGFGKNYIYDHGVPGGFSGQEFMPEGLSPRPVFYEPKEVAAEKRVSTRLQKLAKIRALVKAASR